MIMLKPDKCLRTVYFLGGGSADMMSGTNPDRCWWFGRMSKHEPPRKLSPILSREKANLFARTHWAHLIINPVYDEVYQPACLLGRERLRAPAGKA